jgi:hypothetical protein
MKFRLSFLILLVVVHGASWRHAMYADQAEPGGRQSSPVTRGAGHSQTAAGAQCNCAIAPFTPNPPCANLCVASILALSNARLTTTLKLSPAVRNSITQLKAGGVSSAEFDTWNKSAEGIEFRKALESTSSQQLAPLAKEAQSLKSTAAQ